MRLQRTLALSALLLSLTLPVAAQDRALPDAEPSDPQRALPSQRLEVTNKEIAYAAERLDEAADTDNEPVIRNAFSQSREALQQVRQLVGRLPEAERSPFEAAVAEAESKLAGGDPKAGAAAMRQLREKVISLVNERG